MILYDDKYNFLGMSSHTLGFLGYEDIGDFLSMQSDFANLLVNKEGYIYDFANFNWIDFVLYSGSANKTALVTLKSGQEAKIDLSIKEVHLAHELAGINKLYSIKLISDNFHEISGIPKSEEKLEKALGGFSLSGLVSKEPQEEETEKVEIPAAETQTAFINEEVTPAPLEKEPTNFILNLDEDETTLVEQKPEVQLSTPEISKQESAEEDFKLDFFKQDTEPTDDMGGLTLKTINEEPNQPEASFLLKTEEKEQPKISQENDSFGFNLLEKEPELDIKVQTTKEINKEAEPEIQNHFVLGGLKQEPMELSVKESVEEKEIEIKEPMVESGFKLDFLKTDLTQTQEKEEQTIPVQEKPLKPKDNSKIIQQIKRDIKEIDTISEKKAEPTFVLDLFNQEKKEEEKSLDIPQMPQVEQPLVIQKVKEETLELDQEMIHEVKTKKEEFSKVSFQTEETLKKSEHPSFEKTLNNLFNTPNQEEEIIETSNVENFKQEEKTTTIPTQNSAMALTSLGLDKEDEYELLSDFITDANESIETIEHFVQTKDFDKINYALVKIKSSAEILNLNAIITSAITIREHCANKESEYILQDVQKLKENILMLEEQLEATAL